MKIMEEDEAKEADEENENDEDKNDVFSSLAALPHGLAVQFLCCQKTYKPKKTQWPHTNTRQTSYIR